MENEVMQIKVYLNTPKRRSSLALQWIDPDTGRRKTKAAGTIDREKAEQTRADLQYELNHGLTHEPSKMTWTTFRGVYEAEQMAGRRVATRKKAGYVFDLFEKLTNPSTLGKFT
jgi:hypothetical protein